MQINLVSHEEGAAQKFCAKSHAFLSRPNTQDLAWVDEHDKQILHPLVALEEKELREFVNMYLAGAVFTDRNIRDQNMLTMVFMPLALGALAGWTRADLNQVGCFWAEMKDAGPRSINGMPCFFSVRMMNRSDADRAFAAIGRELKRREKLEI